MQLTQRHTDGLILNRVWTEGVHVDDNTISSANYTNARASYTADLNDDRSLRVSFDITNLFDEGPPLIAGTDQAVDPQYDIYGRRFFVNLRMDF